MSTWESSRLLEHGWLPYAVLPVYIALPASIVITAEIERRTFRLIYYITSEGAVFEVEAAGRAIEGERRILKQKA